MIPWHIVVHKHTGEPTGQLVCGECFDIYFEWYDGEAIKDPTYHYSDRCSICEKNCGDYFHRKEAA